MPAAKYGALAQLGAHHTGSVGVVGSNPICSNTIRPKAPILSEFLAFGEIKITFISDIFIFSYCIKI